MVKVSRLAGVPLNSRVAPVVIVLLQKKVGGESGLKKVIKLQWNVITAAAQK